MELEDWTQNLLGSTWETLGPFLAEEVPLGSAPPGPSMPAIVTTQDDYYILFGWGIPNLNLHVSHYCQRGPTQPMPIHTVDGRNPAPPGMYDTLLIMRNLPYQLVQDSFHQQYHHYHGSFHNN